MKALPWILVGVGAGVALSLVCLNANESEYATSYDGIERAARKTFGWGAGKQAEGKVGSFAGAIKEGVGQLTGNDQLANEGTADRVVGNVKDAAGKVGKAAAQTLHDLNK
jgi:uncharacterized protein YjbJ (UPF0337 family)